MQLGGHLDTAAVCALVGFVAGWFVPALIARLPEPAPPSEEEVAQSAIERDAPPKELYADLARLPGLAWRTALASAVAAACCGLVLGWSWILPTWLFLAPIGTALAVIDLRTWLLPSKLIWPSFVVVIGLGLVAAVVDAAYADLLRAGLGSLVAFVLFHVLWLLPGAGMGYGDVRLSAVLGFALGFLGWWPLAFGLWVGFLLGSVGWVPLRLLRLTRSKRFPFGPFMLVGAVVGVLWGASVGAGLAG